MAATQLSPIAHYAKVSNTYFTIILHPQLNMLSILQVSKNRDAILEAIMATATSISVMSEIRRILDLANNTRTEENVAMKRSPSSSPNQQPQQQQHSQSQQSTPLSTTSGPRKGSNQKKSLQDAPGKGQEAAGASQLRRLPPTGEPAPLPSIVSPPPSMKWVLTCNFDMLSYFRIIS